jgi:hypothetical protein
VNHGLLIARLKVRQARAAFFQCLAHAGHITVPENTEHRSDESPAITISLAELLLQITHHSLRCREANRCSRRLSRL